MFLLSLTHLESESRLRDRILGSAIEMAVPPQAAGLLSREPHAVGQGRRCRVLRGTFQARDPISPGQGGPSAPLPSRACVCDLTYPHPTQTQKPSPTFSPRIPDPAESLPRTWLTAPADPPLQSKPT